jgi:hypothetical protein
LRTTIDGFKNDIISYICRKIPTTFFPNLLRFFLLDLLCFKEQSDLTDQRTWINDLGSNINELHYGFRRSSTSSTVTAPQWFENAGEVNQREIMRFLGARPYTPKLMHYMCNTLKLSQEETETFLNWFYYQRGDNSTSPAVGGNNFASSDTPPSIRRMVTRGTYFLYSLLYQIVHFF